MHTFSAAFLAAVALSAWAHGGEDHGTEAAPAPTVAIAPRATAETEDFELVAVLEGRKLTLMLDRFATNEPVAGADIEVESGSALKAVANQVTPGVYAVQLADAAFAKPGKYPLTIAVQAGESTDLLSATLDLSRPAAGVEHVHAKAEWAVWGASGVLLAAGAGLAAVRRRKQKRNR